MTALPASPVLRRALPTAVWILGIVSLLMDVSSEMIHSVLPAFLIQTLGAGVLAVSVLDGGAVALSLVVKTFSGVLSDRWRQRQRLAAFGYGVSAASKPLFALAGGLPMIVAARALDRFGKGVRGAPRDALIAAVVPPDLRAAAYGLRQSLDTVGAVLGPLVALGVLLACPNRFRLVFLIAVVPAVAAALLMALRVREPEGGGPMGARPRGRWALWRDLPAGFWWAVALGAGVALAQPSESLLLLRAQSVGVPAAWLPAFFVLMNIAGAALAYPMGRLADRVGTRRVVLVGLAGMALTNGVLAVAGGAPLVALGAVLWGANNGVTQGALSAMVAEHAPGEARGTAFGVFNLVLGVATLGASVALGGLWMARSPAVAFGAAAGAAVLVGGVAAWRVRRDRLEAVQPAPAM